jgi:hypothetical protein
MTRRLFVKYLYIQLQFMKIDLSVLELFYAYGQTDGRNNIIRHPQGYEPLPPEIDTFLNSQINRPRSTN